MACYNSECAELRTEKRTAEHNAHAAEREKQRASVLVAGAMRQGYMNDAQRECLLFAFQILTGERDPLIARLIAEVKPRDY